jgi:hypothetical protein
VLRSLPDAKSNMLLNGMYLHDTRQVTKHPMAEQALRTGIIALAKELLLASGHLFTLTSYHSKNFFLQFDSLPIKPV